MEPIIMTLRCDPPLSWFFSQLRWNEGKVKSVEAILRNNTFDSQRAIALYGTLPEEERKSLEKGADPTTVARRWLYGPELAKYPIETAQWMLLSLTNLSKSSPPIIQGYNSIYKEAVFEDVEDTDLETSVRQALPAIETLISERKVGLITAKADRQCFGLHSGESMNKSVLDASWWSFGESVDGSSVSEAQFRKYQAAHRTVAMTTLMGLTVPNLKDSLAKLTGRDMTDQESTVLMDKVCNREVLGWQRRQALLTLLGDAVSNDILRDMHDGLQSLSQYVETGKRQTRRLGGTQYGDKLSGVEVRTTLKSIENELARRNTVSETSQGDEQTDV